MCVIIANDLQMLLQIPHLPSLQAIVTLTSAKDILESRLQELQQRLSATATVQSGRCVCGFGCMCACVCVCDTRVTVTYVLEGSHLCIHALQLFECRF